MDKEHMFDKVATPSDVEKLNRLVIPKQHAKKYFPLDSMGGKGVPLNVEDRNGKAWRFRGVGELGKDRLFIDWRRRPDAPVAQPIVLRLFG
ncbi:hypothetical protein GOBAR_DD33592 [Gossypium barbadense]|nr:hypothetical protein GOBAR_DD33592 [Gossypium barbadense]